MKTTTCKNFSRLLVICLSFFTFITSASAQQVSSTLIESWQDTDWAPTSQSVNAYDDNNQLISTTMQTWDEESISWVNAVRMMYVNNPNGTVSQSTVQSWDSESASWVDAQRTTNTYTSFDEIATSTSEIWTGDLWMAMTQTTYDYDAGEMMISETSQQWNFISSSWLNTSRILYVNTGSGMVSQSTHQQWSEGTSSWTDTNRNTYTYNANDEVLTVLSETWNGTSWTNAMFDTYTYNSNGNLINSLTQSWDAAATDWVNGSQQLFTNNADGTPSQIVSQDWEGGVWINAVRITFTYLALGVNDQDRPLVSAYPVPASDQLIINIPNFNLSQDYVVSNLSGKTIMNGILNGQQTPIDVSALSSGIYFVRIGTTGDLVRFVKN